jgi:SAM-dependent methyltransferase
MLVMASELGLEGTPASDSIPRVLAQEYFSKPMHALARSYDLAAQRSTWGVGMGDSPLSSAASMGLMDSTSGWILTTEASGWQGDGVSTRSFFDRMFEPCPLKQRQLNLSSVIEFILCSGVLCSIHPRYDLALLEIARILKSGGQLVLTLPTPGYTSALLPTRLFECLGLRKLAVLYSKQVNERNQHHKLEYLEWWQKELERAGLKIEEYVHYFAASEAAWWSILNMRPFQLFAVFRYLPRFIQRIATDFTERVTRAVPRSIQPAEQECGYLLISVRKP